MSGIGLIVNATSRRHKRNRALFARMRELVGPDGIAIRTGSVDEVPAACELFRQADVDVVAVSGGDGSAGAAVTHLRKVYGDQPLPHIALVCGGTMNTVAGSAGVRRGRPDKVLKRVIDAYRGGRMSVLELPTIEADGRLGFLFGAGCLHGFLAEYYDRGKGEPTAATAASTLFAALAGSPFDRDVTKRVIRPFDGRVVVDGDDWGQRGWFGVAAGTVEQIGLGFKPFYKAFQRSDRMHVVGVNSTAMKFSASLPRLHMAKPLPKPSVDSLAAEVVLESRDGSPVRYIMDGDLGEASSPLTARVGPLVRLVVDRLPAKARVARPL